MTCNCYIIFRVNYSMDLQHTVIEADSQSQCIVCKKKPDQILLPQHVCNACLPVIVVHTSTRAHAGAGNNVACHVGSMWLQELCGHANQQFLLAVHGWGGMDDALYRSVVCTRLNYRLCQLVLLLCTISLANNIKPLVNIMTAVQCLQDNPLVLIPHVHMHTVHAAFSV